MSITCCCLSWEQESINDRGSWQNESENDRRDHLWRKEHDWNVGDRANRKGSEIAVDPVLVNVVIKTHQENEAYGMEKERMVVINKSQSAAAIQRACTASGCAAFFLLFLNCITLRLPRHKIMSSRQPSSGRNYNQPWWVWPLEKVCFII